MKRSFLCVAILLLAMVSSSVLAFDPGVFPESKGFTVKYDEFTKTGTINNYQNSSFLSSIPVMRTGYDGKVNMYPSIIMVNIPGFPEAVFRFAVIYKGDSWLFANEVIFSITGTSYIYDVDLC